MKRQTAIAASILGVLAAIGAMAINVASLPAATPEPTQLAPASSLDLFAGIAAGQLDVKFIPKNDREARLLVANRTSGPLSVRLPDGFAAVPVLAQFGAPARPRGNGAQQQNQAVGAAGAPVGFPPGARNNFMGRPMIGNGLFNVAAKQAVEFRFAIVCLEHGKKEPRPTVPYEIRPLDAVTAETGVRELLKLLGEEKVDQRAAQAAAWHLANRMSWEELAAKRIEHLGSPSEPYFTFAHLMAAKQAVDTATEAARRGSQDRGAVATP